MTVRVRKASLERTPDRQRSLMHLCIFCGRRQRSASTLPWPRKRHGRYGSLSFLESCAISGSGIFDRQSVKRLVSLVSFVQSDEWFGSRFGNHLDRYKLYLSYISFLYLLLLPLGSAGEHLVTGERFLVTVCCINIPWVFHPWVFASLIP